MACNYLRITDQYIPIYPFLIFLNRDEFHHRPTEALHWWENGNILGGRDVTAGGTWLASNRQGRVAFVTNVRQLTSLSAVFAKSRGSKIGARFRDCLNQYGDGELPVTEMIDKLMGNTVKDDLSKLPQIYPPEFEYQLSSVFVDTVSVKGRYGTSSTSALAVKASGEVFFYEKYLENDMWIEHTEAYLIEKNEK
ncbi:hypothetical protein CTI12_AA554070 [Artemisia annua]|uniref:NRDE family protein n=1 Tax=Artemisia annua TaxID=35608 RepID=A0A2U1KXE0_ARTAN|nr:hypothetical protein CTI12_AA554070 [Artemisia annua]